MLTFIFPSIVNILWGLILYSINENSKRKSSIFLIIKSIFHFPSKLLHGFYLHFVMLKNKIPKPSLASHFAKLIRKKIRRMFYVINIVCVSGKLLRSFVAIVANFCFPFNKTKQKKKENKNSIWCDFGKLMSKP